jgi:phenylpyruvate tautomerase PptA (4-oxalocrotonate tautomerase family)
MSCRVVEATVSALPLDYDGRHSYSSYDDHHSEGATMPSIDVILPEGLLPAGQHRRLAAGLTEALLEAEGAPLADPYLENTSAVIHELPPEAVHTAGTDRARTVRVQVLTPPGALGRDAQKQLVARATEVVAEVVGDPTQAARTWVFLTEAAEGGWGIAGLAFGREEFAALAAGR